LKPARYKKAFLKQFSDLSPEKKTLVWKAIEVLENFRGESVTSHGLAVKKLHETSRWKVFEARAGIDLRVVWVESSEESVFSLIGNHDDVRRFLKNL